MANNNKNVRELEFKSIPALLWQYFVPAFAGMIINSLYNIVDRIFIGQGVGALALSGLSAVFPIMLIMMAFGMLVGMGARVRVSLNLGKKNYTRAEEVLGNAFILIILIALFITLTGFLIKGPMLRLFGAGPEIYGYANDYLNIILLGSVFNITGFSLNSIIRAEGNAKIAMYSMFISAGINILLDPLFIFVFDLGVKGAAYATIISQIILCIWVISHFRSKNSVIKLRRNRFKLNREIIFYIFAIGFAPFSMQLAASFVQGTFNTQLIKHGGDIAVGAMGIINSMAMLIVMSIISITMAAQPILGFNYGAQNYGRVKKTFLISMKAASFIALGGFLLVQLFPAFIIKLFNTESQELLEIGMRGLRIYFLAFPLIGFQIITSSYFQSVGKAGIAAILSLLRQVIVLIPILIFLPGVIGLDGVWASAPISDTVSALVVSFFLIREMKKLNRLIEA